MMFAVLHNLKNYHSYSRAYFTLCRNYQDIYVDICVNPRNPIMKRGKKLAWEYNKQEELAWGGLKEDSWTIWSTREAKLTEWCVKLNLVFGHGLHLMRRVNGKAFHWPKYTEPVQIYIKRTSNDMKSALYSFLNLRIFNFLTPYSN